MITLEKDGTYTRNVNGKKYNVGKNDSRFRDIEKEYNAQEMDKVGIPEYYGSTGDVTGKVSRTNSFVGAPSAVAPMNATVGAEPTGYDAYESIMRDSLMKQQKANNDATEAAIGTLRTGMDNTNRGYDQAAQNAYINMMMTKRDMPQQLAALGLSGTGMSESIAMQNAMNYQNNLNTNEIERNAVMQDFYNQIAGQRAQAGLQNAELEAATGQNLANVYLQLLMQERERQLAEKQQQEAYAREDLANKTSMLMNLGMATPEVASYLGVNQATLQQALNRLYGGSSGGSSGGVATGSTTGNNNNGYLKAISNNLGVNLDGVNPRWYALIDGKHSRDEVTNVLETALANGNMSDAEAERIMAIYNYLGY